MCVFKSLSVLGGAGAEIGQTEGQWRETLFMCSHKKHSLHPCYMPGSVGHRDPIFYSFIHPSILPVNVEGSLGQRRGEWAGRGLTAKELGAVGKQKFPGEGHTVFYTPG